MKNFFKELAVSTNGNPFMCIAVLMCLLIGFNLLESIIEKLIWGGSFPHPIDLIALGSFIGASIYSVYVCADFQRERNNEY